MEGETENSTQVRYSGLSGTRMGTGVGEGLLHLRDGGGAGCPADIIETATANIGEAYGAP